MKRLLFPALFQIFWSSEAGATPDPVDSLAVLGRQAFTQTTIHISGHKTVTAALLDAVDKGSTVTGIADFDSLSAVYGLMGIYRNGVSSGFYGHRFRLHFPPDENVTSIVEAYQNLPVVNSARSVKNPYPDTTRKSADGFRTVLKFLGGTVGGLGTLIFHADAFGLEWCDDNVPEEANCGKPKSTKERGVAVSAISVGIAVGVTVWDTHDRFLYTMAGSLLGFGVSTAIIDRGWTGVGIPPLGLMVPFLPVIGATAASEWSRGRSESRRYSLGLRPESKGGLSVVATLRF